MSIYLKRVCLWGCLSGLAFVFIYFKKNKKIDETTEEIEQF